MTVLNTTSSNGTLSDVEKELLLMNAYDYIDEEKAQELGLSESLIRKYEQSILQKFSSESMSSAIRVAFEMNILQLTYPPIPTKK